MNNIKYYKRYFNDFGGTTYYYKKNILTGEWYTYHDKVHGWLWLSEWRGKEGKITDIVEVPESEVFIACL